MIENNDKENIQFLVNFIDCTRIDIRGLNNNKTYKVNFVDQDTNNIPYSVELKCNMYGEATTKYFVNWKIDVYEKLEDLAEKLVFSYKINLENQRVLIGFESMAIGDNIAWMPYVEEFRLKHNCKIILATFHNYLFKNSYPEIEFCSPGEVIHNICAQYKIGCFEENYRNKRHWRLIPLQQVATDILGLHYKEIRPKIDVEPNLLKRSGRKYVCLCEHGTLKAKEWNYDNGWQDIVDYLDDLGYDVVVVGNKPTNLIRVQEFTNYSLPEIVSLINNSSFFIGLGSGLSWISYALNKKTIMISGFSKPYCEFTIDNYRVTAPDEYCNGCFNDLKYKIERTNHNWCPKNNNFICSKSIRPDSIKTKIHEIIKDLGLELRRQT